MVKKKKKKKKKKPQKSERKKDSAKKERGHEAVGWFGYAQGLRSRLGGVILAGIRDSGNTKRLGRLAPRGAAANEPLLCPSIYSVQLRHLPSSAASGSIPAHLKRCR